MMIKNNGTGGAGGVVRYTSLMVVPAASLDSVYVRPVQDALVEMDDLSGTAQRMAMRRWSGKAHRLAARRTTSVSCKSAERRFTTRAMFAAETGRNYYQ